MKSFDVNVLIYAHREDHEHHTFFRDFFEGYVRGPGMFALSPLIAAGFVRIVIHPRYPNGPTPIHEALSVIDSLASLGNCTWASPGQRHWQITSNLCRGTGCTGKNVADAQHAAIAIEHACTWVTHDTDFQAFQSYGLQLELLQP